MFYSNTIFKAGTSLDSNTITTLIGTINFVTTLVGMFLLTIAGRRTIMLWSFFFIAIILVLIGFLSLAGESTAVIILILVFISLFEFGPGPITWLYMAEIMQDKAVSIATVVNWSVSFIISACIPMIIDAIGSENIGYIFIFVGASTAIGYVFIFVFMLETRGKTF
jgi:MFS family permease